ncbi:hypothetical protein EFK54_15325 [Escherichia coli]|nr:hypothetical protein [Escherichia coli]
MAGKAHGNGDRRGDNSICGLGDRLRRLTAGICLITQTIFPVNRCIRKCACRALQPSTAAARAGT